MVVFRTDKSDILPNDKFDRDSIECDNRHFVKCDRQIDVTVQNVSDKSDKALIDDVDV